MRKLLRLSMALGVAASPVLLLPGSGAFAGTVLTVNSPADAPDVNPGDGLCDTGAATSTSGRECTLRAAIQEANEPGPSGVIAFSIPIDIDPTIQLESPLPPITTRLVIDGTTQPGFAGTPAVVIDGSETDTGAGLELRGDDSTIRGLVIRGFAGAAIAVYGDRVTIAGNYLGTERDGVTAAGNADGIVVSGRRTVIGGQSLSDRNVISGNRGDGIVVAGAERTEVAGNHIGLDAIGASAVPNQGDGIEVVGGADRASIGPDNTIAGNGGHGVEVKSGATLVEVLGNAIGTSADGSAPLGNGLTGVAVGGDAVVVETNQISGNATDGVRVDGGSVILRGNRIGTDGGGSGAIPNGRDGVYIGSQAATASAVGGTRSGDGNVIAFNMGAGISLGEDPDLQVAIVSNSIFGNGGVGIDLPGPGPTPNDEGDRDVGPNEALNFPEVTDIVDNGESVDVHFDLDVPVGSYRVEFFANPSGADPSGYGEGEELRATTNVRRAGTDIEFVHTLSAAPGETLTATATRCANPSCSRLVSTSEFSEAVAVSMANHAPSLDPIPNRQVREGAPISFTASASDLDPADRLSFHLVGGPSGASIDSSTGRFAWTPTEAQGPGSYTFEVLVSDDGNPIASDSQTVTIDVDEVNQPPVVTGPGDQSNQAGEAVDLDIEAYDPDIPAGRLSFEASGLPSGLSIDPDTGRITGVVEGGGAPQRVTVTVTDDGIPALSGQAHFNWHTSSINGPPSLEPIADRSVSEQFPLRFIARATDPDGDSLTFDLVGAPPGSSIDSGTGVFEWTPSEFQGPGVYTLSIEVTDSGSPGLTDVETFDVTVTEVNRSPFAVDDETTTEEDTPVTLEVLANDRDLDFPADTLRVDSVGQPDHGEISVAGGAVTYTPPLDFNGLARFEYTVGDGLASATGSVSITVTAVNDAPVATRDRFHLDSYLPVTLEVLANDFDPDDDPLTVELTSVPSSGAVSLHGNEIVYRPRNGWTGTATFGYTVSDPDGETSEATVEVVVDDQVLLAARMLADALGVDTLAFELASPSAGATAHHLISLDAISLFAQALLEAADALKVPLAFLALTAAAINGLGGRSRLPTLLYGNRPRHWAVARLPRQERLPALAEPGGGEVVYTYEPTATGLVSTGRPKRVGGVEWLPIETPIGTAWVLRHYLSEQSDLRAFAEDPRPVRLAHDLVDRLRDGNGIRHLIGAGGLTVALSGASRHISLDDISEITSRPRHRSRPGRLPMAPGEFSAAVARPLVEAYETTPTLTVELPHSRTAWIPAECWNLPYLALPGDGTVQPWLVFFEYRDGKAWIAGLGIDE